MSASKIINFYHDSSLPAAILFASAYLPLAAWGVVHIIYARRKDVAYTLAFFCLVRLTAFVLRAVLTGRSATASTKGIFTTAEILFNIGFFGLVYSAYTLVLDKEEQRTDSDDTSDAPQRGPPKGWLMQLTQNRGLFATVFTAASILGIIAFSMSSGSGGEGRQNQDGNDDEKDLIKALRKASLIILLVLCVLQAFQTLVLARRELSARRQRGPSGLRGFNKKYWIFILLFVSLLLLIRQVFTTIAFDDIKKRYNDRLFYPLSALPEIVATICLLYLIPVAPSDPRFVALGHQTGRSDDNHNIMADPAAPRRSSSAA